MKTVKLIIGILLLPLTVICAYTFLLHIISFPWLERPYVYFTGGALCGGALCALHKGKSMAYVVAHEIMHAAAVTLCGGKLVSFFVSHRSGYVQTTKENFIVSLLPYCIPFYAMILFLGYFGISIFITTEKILPVCIFLLGITIAHHIIMTCLSIAEGQSDITSQGRLFSFDCIILGNVLSIGFLLGIFLAEVKLQLVLQQSVASIKQLLTY